MARVTRAPAAEVDAIEIWAYIADHNPEAADRLLDRIDAMIGTLAMQPLAGKSIPELAVDLRFIPVGSYLIFYRPGEDGIEIVRILHSARDVTADYFRE